MINQQNIATMQQKFVIQIDERTLKRVKPFDREELVKAYLQLFAGFSWVNWTNGHSLGRAWQTALSQCKAFCESKNKKNPAAKYLNAACNGHRKYWSQVIMTHKNRENTINPQDEKVKHLREHGQRMIRQAMDKINLILARYNEYTLEVSHSAAMEATAEYAGRAQYNNVPDKNAAVMEHGQTPTQQQAAMPMAQSGQVMQQELPQQSAVKQTENVVAASAQQRPAVQNVPQVQRVAQPMQMAQAVNVQQQRPAVQNVPQVQRVAQPMQMAQAANVQQQRPAVQNVPQVQRVAQPMQMAQAANVQQQRPAVQNVPQVQRVAQPMQMAQAANVQQQRPAVQSVPQVQRVVQSMQIAQPLKVQQQRPAVQSVPQVAQVKQKRPYVKPMAQVIKEKKPYVAPQMSVRENQFAKQIKSETQTKAASMINAQQKVQKMNMFMFGNFNQRAA